jgi:hypothetical protein
VHFFINIFIIFIMVTVGHGGLSKYAESAFTQFVNTLCTAKRQYFTKLHSNLF